MIVAAAFLPHPPLLLREYASLADPAADLRARCRRALGEVAEIGVDRLIVLAGAERTPPTISTRAVLGVRVAAELLVGLEVITPTPGNSVHSTHSTLHPEAAQWTELPADRVVTVPFDADAAEVADSGAELVTRAEGARTAVLVMGDGSARRGEKAPGHLDERAFGFDDRVTTALAAGDPGALRDLDAELAGELLAAGRAAWQVMAAAAPGPARVVSTHAEDPFGVLYPVTVWSWA